MSWSGCKIWYLISRTVSDDDAHRGDIPVETKSVRLKAPSWRADPSIRMDDVQDLSHN
jgi:hypothetical protein